MRKSWANQIEKWNEQVKIGHANVVARELLELSRGEVPAEFLSVVANLSWRVSQPRVGLRLLSPQWRKQNKITAESHPQVLLEYGACLTELGALAEAKDVLNSCVPFEPKAEFYLALLGFKEWDYENGARLLESYLAKIDNGYHQYVVRVNLASAYLNTGQHGRAKLILAGLKPELKERRHFLLLGNCFEIESQIYFEAGDYDHALNLLLEARSLLGDSMNRGWLYAEKWIFLNELFRARISAEGILLHFAERMAGLKIRAREMNSWEVIRELDLYWSIATSDSDLATRVYVGTPSPYYRKRILRILQRFGTPPLRESLVLVPAETKEEPALTNRDLVGTAETGQSLLIRKLVLFLLSDFYAPFSLGHLYSAIFPGEHFDPDSSPARIFQLIRRCRKWLSGRYPGLSIESTPQGYALKFSGGTSVEIFRDFADGFVGVDDPRLLYIREVFGNERFSAAELAEKMKTSIRSVNRLLRKLGEEGKIKSEGQARYTRFRVV